MYIANVIQVVGKILDKNLKQKNTNGILNFNYTEPKYICECIINLGSCNSFKCI